MVNLISRWQGIQSARVTFHGKKKGSKLREQVIPGIGWQRSHHLGWPSTEQALETYRVRKLLRYMYMYSGPALITVHTVAVLHLCAVLATSAMHSAKAILTITSLSLGMWCWRIFICNMITQHYVASSPDPHIPVHINVSPNFQRCIQKALLKGYGRYRGSS